MKYLLMICDDEKIYHSFTPARQQKMHADYMKFGQDFRANILGGNALQSTSTATCVKVRDGKRLTTDGPFAETKEQIGGYYLVEAKDLDEAIHIASKIPGALDGTIEVRPIMEVG